MLDRISAEPNPQDNAEKDNHESVDAQESGHPPSPNDHADLSDEPLLQVNHFLPSDQDTAHLAMVNRRLHSLFKVEIGKKTANDAARCAIHPTEENVEILTALLKAWPALLLHSVRVKNRHDMEIQGTVYQIALHEGDNELIDDVIQPAFQRLHHGLEMMEAQRKKWLSDGWVEAEEKKFKSACVAIEQLFTVFRSASNANDVTELPQYPYTITINHQGAKKALEVCKESIAALYQPTVKITIGRDPIIRLLEQVNDRFEENYNALGEYDSPRNNAIIREVYGYCQRFAPINYMQAFAMGVYNIVENKEKLVRSFEYRMWPGNFILPLDSDPQSRLGYEHFADEWAWLRGRLPDLQNFLSVKNSSCSTIVRYATLGKE